MNRVAMRMQTVLLRRRNAALRRQAREWRKQYGQMCASILNTRQLMRDHIRDAARELRAIETSIDRMEDSER